MDKTKIIIFAAVALIVVIIVVVIIASPAKPPTPPAATLEFWSVFDDSSVYQPLIQQYQKLYPHITINYYKKDINLYEKELVDALAAGRGPDIFSINNVWLPKHKNKLAPAPATLITPKTVSESFVDVVSRDFIYENKIYALPLSVDSLALFYNKDLLNSAGLSLPPKTWTDFNAAVERLTKRDVKNNILQAGAAIGTAKNINRSTDILAALMLQSGAKMVSDDKLSASFNQYITSGSETINPGQQALAFYISFANPLSKVYTWNSLQHYSIDAFVEGKVAMMFNYAYQAAIVAARAPHLDFGVTFLPQISSGSRKATLANYWGQAVSRSSKNQIEAWNFISWLSSKDISQTYLDATEKPASRRDLIDAQKASAVLGVFAEQALFAKSWWEIDNLAIEQIFADMIESTVSGRATINDALSRSQTQVTELMRRK